MLYCTNYRSIFIIIFQEVQSSERGHTNVCLVVNIFTVFSHYRTKVLLEGCQATNRLKYVGGQGSTGFNNQLQNIADMNEETQHKCT